MSKTYWTDEMMRKFIDQASAELGKSVVSGEEIKSFAAKHEYQIPFFILAQRVSWNQYKLVMPGDFEVSDQVTPEFVDDKELVVMNSQKTTTPELPHGDIMGSISFVPQKDKRYVPWGRYNDLKAIIKSNVFFPVYITGLSGNGKTYMVEQVCADCNREFFRVNITKETSEDDLIGSMRLINDGGVTVMKWIDGPVTVAAERGGILLMDEVDLGGVHLMCMQPVLEGKPFFIKKISKWIYPKKGFNIIATANTKGRGDDTAKFIGTNVMNEAMLERFPVTFDQAYPSPSVERKIIAKQLDNLGGKMEDTQIDTLINWAESIRKTYDDGGMDDLITTRRLVQIVEAFVIFGDLEKAIHDCCSRFPDSTKEPFLELYKKMTETVQKPKIKESEVVEEKKEEDDIEMPF